MSGKRAKEGAPHIGMAVFAAGTMALGLAIGFEALRLMERIDAGLGKVFSPEGIGGSFRETDPVILWIGTGLLAFALPAVILNIPGTWRRLVIWGVTLLLTVSWAPVLVLASRKPEIGVALVAVLWSGMCAMFYTMNHKLPADAVDVKPGKANDGKN